MANKILIKRGTRAQLDAAAGASTPTLNIGELYYITDEQRIAVGTANNAYEMFLKSTESVALDADLTAISELTGTSGFLKKTAADTWALDTSTFITAEAPNFNNTNGATFAGTSGSVKVVATGAASGTLTLPNATGTIATTANINSGTLDVSISGTAPTAGTALSWGTTTGFNANSSGTTTYDLRVSPSITALATLMNTATAGVIRRSGINSYSVDTNTFITAEAPNFNLANGAQFAGSSGSVKVVAAGAASGTLTLPNATGTIATTANIPTVNAGALTLNIGAAATTSNSVTVSTGTGFTADSSTGVTYSISIGPSISALATTMTGAGTSGLLSKSGQDTYTLVNPNTFYASTTTLNQIAVPIASVDLNSQKIIGLAEPTLAQDAATKNYVDTVAQGLDAKASVRAATTVAGGNITLSGAQTIDGVSIVAPNRVLVKNQTDPNQNGIWIANASAWSRATDADLWNELVSAFVFVEEGTLNADTGWVCTANPGQTIGSSPVAFVQFSAAGAYTAGDGMTSTGNTFNVVGTANRIVANANSIDIASNYVGQNTITTLGTIGTGLWQGTQVGAIYGGTGQTTYATGDFLYATAANTLGKLTNTTTAQSETAARNVLVMDPATGTPSWSSTIDGGTF